MTQQRRRVSIIEALINTGVGFGVAFATNVLVLPLFGLHPSLSDTTWITLVFTFVSIVRSYALRRFFVWLHNKGHLI